MDYSIVKSLHIIFIVTWFAGLFYIVRLFVYHAESHEKGNTLMLDQYKLMEKRLWFGITWPSMILATIFGLLMLHLNPALLQMDWMKAKLLFVVGLIAYHFSLQFFYKKLQVGAYKTSTFYRYWNEVATLFLVAIIFLAVTKNVNNWWKGALGLVVFSVILMIAIKIYKRIREK